MFDLSDQAADAFSLCFIYSDTDGSIPVYDSNEIHFRQRFVLTPTFHETAIRCTKATLHHDPGKHYVCCHDEPAVWHRVPTQIIDKHDMVIAVKRRPVMCDLASLHQFRGLRLPDGFTESTASSSTWLVARKWLETCITSHKQCTSDLRPQRQLPTRLISVNDSFGLRARLVSTKQLPIDTCYTTLSYRWGTEPNLKLTSNMLEVFATAIPVADLPATLREAMVATLELGYRYIWIDSVCIIQDCSADWDIEASKMSDYFTGAVCNLAAAKSADCHDGLFGERVEDVARPCLVQDLWTNTHPQMAYWVNNAARRFHDMLNGSELSRRGWIMQELMLAPRVLYFGPDEVFWECGSFRAAESNPGTWLNLQYQGLLGNTQLHTRSRLASPDLIKESKHVPWLEVVMAYSQRRLTYPVKDKLAAIGGLASRYGPGEDYFAGLWRESLLHNLAWMTVKLYGRYT